jgi:hypothetical protein
MEDIYAGVFSSSGHNKEAYDDDVVSFFIHCYHIRDWVWRLNRVGITVRQIDSFIDRHKPLRICADLANGSKHCKLTRSLRTDRQPYISGTERRISTWFTDNGGREVMKCKYTIVSDTELIDALELARECVRLWDSYVSELEAHNKQVNKDASR